MRRMAAAAMSLALLGSLGCKGETKIQDNPETLDNLKSCETKLQDKIAYINTLNEQITKLESGGATADGDAAVVVKIEGEAMSITAGADKGPHSGGGDPKGNAKDLELYEAFQAALKRSRGAIKKCYQSALKKNSALSSRTISLQIDVNYKTSGEVKSARFNPKVSDQFNSCMDGVANKWKLPAMPRAVSFSYTQTLTPE